MLLAQIIMCPPYAFHYATGNHNTSTRSAYKMLFYGYLDGLLDFSQQGRKACYIPNYSLTPLCFHGWGTHGVLKVHRLLT